MEIVSEAHKIFLTDVLDAQVDFILIGGYAVIYYGYPRLTTDMDLWLKPDNDNKFKLLGVLKKHGIKQEDIDVVKDLDFTKVHVFHIGEGKNKIDFLTKVVGVTYDEADQQKVFFPLGDKQIPIIQYHHLITSKMMSDRLKDKADVDELQKINILKKKPE